MEGMRLVYIHHMMIREPLKIWMDPKVLEVITQSWMTQTGETVRPIQCVDHDTKERQTLILALPQIVAIRIPEISRNGPAAPADVTGLVDLDKE